MNRLTTYVSDHSLDPTTAMNLPQEHGIISDNCIWSSDVPDCDAAAAIAFLEKGKNE